MIAAQSSRRALIFTAAQSSLHCGFSALEDQAGRRYVLGVMSRDGTSMKKVALALVAVLSLLSIVGCTSMPPPPMVTKG
jgi:hypothetical protein